MSAVLKSDTNFIPCFLRLDVRKHTTFPPVTGIYENTIGGVHMMTVNNQNLRDILRAQILTLTDHQAEYVLYRLSLLMEEFAAGSPVVSQR